MRRLVSDYGESMVKVEAPCFLTCRNHYTNNGGPYGI